MTNIKKKELKHFIIGSNYFFKDIKNFTPGDTDELFIEENPIGYSINYQLTGHGHCLFKWKRMTPEEYIEIHLKGLPMAVGKFLVPELCKEIGFTIKHLKQLEPVFNKLDDKHKYEKIIYDAYILNNDFVLTDEQRLQAYEEYKKYR